MTFRRILVGWDGSEPSDAAVRLTSAYAHQIGAGVEVLAAFDQPGDVLTGCGVFSGIGRPCCHLSSGVAPDLTL